MGQGMRQSAVRQNRRGKRCKGTEAVASYLYRKCGRMRYDEYLRQG